MTTTSISLIKKLLLLFLVFAGLHFAKAFLMPLSVGCVLATLLYPFCKWMEGKKLPKGLAVFICLLILLIFITGIVTLISLQVAAITNDFALIKLRTVNSLNHIQEFLFNHLGISHQKQLQIFNDEQPSVSSIIQMIGGSLVNLLTCFILILVYFFCLLYYRAHIKTFILRLSPPAQQTETEQIIYSTARVSQQYLLGLAKMILCLWIMYAIAFSLLGVQNAFFFAILCGLLEIVPYIGNFTGTAIAVLVAAVHGAGLPLLAGIVVTYVVIQFIQGWILEPIIVGPQVKINPFTTIIVLVLGELVWGISGIFLAIPLIAMFKIICDHIEPLKPFGFLIGEIETKKISLAAIIK